MKDYNISWKVLDSFMKQETPSLNEMYKEKKNLSFLAILPYACFGGFIGIVLFTFAWLYGMFAYGYVISVLWAWFVMPLFPDMPTLNFLHAAGLYVIIDLLTRSHAYKKPDPNQSNTDKVWALIVPVITPWVSLLSGYIIYYMMM